MSQRAVSLNRSPWQGVFYLTGGGSGLLAELLGTPGASKTVLEVVVPYAQSSLTELLGKSPDQACSDATARTLAMAAFQRARHLSTSQESEHTFGLGCTASLATDRSKRGKHRAHIALQTQAATYTAHLQLEGDRASEEQSLVDMLWHALGRSLDIPLDTPPPEMFDADLTHALDHWRALVLDEATAHATQAHDGKLLFPGAFNPLHHAHERMLEIAESKTGLGGAYELSIINVDKPLLDYTEIESRLGQFSKPVWLTRLPTFLDKARHFPGAHFIVGSDTLVRINDPKYYDSTSARDEALVELADLGCRFVVFGRQMEGEFRTLSDLELPAGVRSMCVEISEAEFHEPVSSTQLRMTPP
jgi:nicotinamide mononucleotide (NMN) deamidase PncC